MKVVGILFVFCMLITGCATTPFGIIGREMTRGKINKLEMGMSRQEVTKLLGKPYRTETLQGADKVLLVYLYWTDIKSADGAITDDELTPLVFDNNKLIGWGWSFLEDNKNKYEIRVR
jgi:hypothetical protein